MSTRLLMISSVAFLAAAGLAASFLPEEILRHAGSPGRTFEVLIVQSAGAAYMGFAILNWFSRGHLLGGIYGRPLVLANFLHFAVVALAVLKVLIDGERATEIIIGVAVYSIFAAGFGFVLFTHPRTPDSSQ